MVDISVTGGAFAKGLLSDAFRSLEDAKFVSRSDGEITYASESALLHVVGHIWGEGDQEPSEEELWQSEVYSFELTFGGRTLKFEGVAMPLDDLLAAASVTDITSRWDDGRHDYDIQGTNGRDFIQGGDFWSTNWIEGGGGRDTIVSTGWKDSISGDNGKDRIIIENEGHGWIVGGKGRDVFEFHHSGSGNTIGDFNTRQDRIDLKSFAKDFAESLDVKGKMFDFIGDDKFEGDGLELRYFHRLDHGSVETVIQVAGDGLKDTILEIAGKVNLDAGDFIL